MQKYYFYLEPFTFVFLQKEEFLIYNSVSYKGEIFKTSARLKRLISQLLDLGNMYCIELTDKEVKEKEIEGFIIFVRESFSGDLVSANIFKRPAIFPPVLKLQYSIDRLKTTTFRHIGEEIINLLKEVSIYIGGGNPTSTLINIQVYKQFDYVKKSNEEYLPFHKMRTFLNSLENCQLKNLNIIGGNIFAYPDTDILVKELIRIPGIKYFYSSYRDIPVDINLYSFLQYPQFLLKVLIDFPIDTKILDLIVHSIFKNNCYVEFLFAVTSVNDYNQANSIIKKYVINNYEIKPVFTGHNVDFFEEYIYLSEEDIPQAKISRSQIFINQSLNIFNFGKLRVMTNGSVYSGFNGVSIGTIRIPLINLLHKELEKPESWLKLRNNKPCKTCVYQWICPPPSGYEHAIGKANLCHIVE
jgi:pseudo-rSAM protein